MLIFVTVYLILFWLPEVGIILLDACAMVCGGSTCLAFCFQCKCSYSLTYSIAGRRHESRLINLNLFKSALSANRCGSVYCLILEVKFSTVAYVCVNSAIASKIVSS